MKHSYRKVNKHNWYVSVSIVNGSKSIIMCIGRLIARIAVVYKLTKVHSSSNYPALPCFINLYDLLTFWNHINWCIAIDTVII